jgi:hypothetical protein
MTHLEDAVRDFLYQVTLREYSAVASVRKGAQITYMSREARHQWQVLGKVEWLDPAKTVEMGNVSSQLPLDEGLMTDRF